MIAACASNSGKTVTTLGLISALECLGIPVIAAKCGPDYIDAGWLGWATEKPVANLDSRMASENGLERLIARMTAINKGLIVIEGAMGLYDGDREGRASCAELAARLNIPIILLLNAKGVGHSLGAIAQGFLDFQADWMGEYGRPRFLGVICTHTGSARHEELCREILKPILKSKNLGFFGCLGSKEAPQIPSRHLGLTGAKEVGLDKQNLALWFKKACPPERILKALNYTSQETNQNGESSFFFPSVKKKAELTIAIARDDAFSFCYADLPAMLAEMGACVAFFSPLQDDKIPCCDGIYLPGGYPELFAEKLAANRGMLNAIKEKAAQGTPIYGECGGYIYLGKSLHDSRGKIYEFCGLLPIHFEMTNKLAALGYREIEQAEVHSTLLKGEKLNGHEFHYAKVLPNQKGRHLWLYKDIYGRACFDGYVEGNIMGGFTHLYPEGSRKFWRAWLDQCLNNKKRQNGN